MRRGRAKNEEGHGKSTINSRISMATGMGTSGTGTSGMGASGMSLSVRAVLLKVSVTVCQ